MEIYSRADATIVIREFTRVIFKIINTNITKRMRACAQIGWRHVLFIFAYADNFGTYEHRLDCQISDNDGALPLFMPFTYMYGRGECTEGILRLMDINAAHFDIGSSF